MSPPKSMYHSVFQSLTRTFFGGQSSSPLRTLIGTTLSHPDYVRVPEKLYSNAHHDPLAAKSRVLRKLGKRETEKLTAETGRFIVKNTRVVSKADFFSNVALVNKSIRQWMRLHPLLRCNVAEIENESYFVYNSKIVDDPHSIDPNNVDDLDNVEFIFMQKGQITATATSLDEMSGLLREVHFKESDEINIFRDLLWSLKFFAINDQTNSNNPEVERELEIFFLIHHAIADGVCVHYNLLELLELIEANFSAEKLVGLPLVTECLPSREELFISGNRSLGQQQQLPAVNFPLFALEQTPFKLTASHSRLDKMEEGDCYLQSIDSKGQIKPSWNLATMRSISRNSETASLTFHLEEHKLKRLLDNCRKNECKLTGCINMLLCYSFSKLFKQHNFVSRALPDNSPTSDSRSSFIKYYNSVSFRNMKTTTCQSIDLSTMGLYITGFIDHASIAEDLNEAQESFDLDKFWLKARQSCQKLHEFIDRGGAYLPASCAPAACVQPPQLNFHFAVSNMLAAPAKTAKMSCSRVTQTFTCGDLALPAVNDFLVCLYLVSVDGRLYGIFRYSKALKQSVMEAELFKFFFDFLDKLCQ